MKDLIPLGIGVYDNDPDNEFLVKHNASIRTAAWKAIPLGLFSGDVLDLEIDELTQSIRIKLWESHRMRPITHPKAYIRKIAHTKAVDIVRRHKPSVSVSTSQDGESELGDFLVAKNEGLQDPAFEFEHEEISASFLTKLVDTILSLPTRQRHAMLYALKEQWDDALPLIKALKARGIVIEAIDLPQQKNEIFLLKASLPIARKKLQWLREELSTCNKD